DAYGTLRAQFDALTEEHDKISTLSQKILQERDALRTHLSELEEQTTSWQFDEEAENYPLELDLAMQAWRGVATNRDPSLTVKQQLIAWLNQHYPKLTGEATERIATVANWEKRGGRPAQS
ncbi:hypothetical protein, partial [Zoogloea sp.]|uniref:hypothetical protein n=1 Tax=Zoogloea sp. TaxID=49181 RepID=UPI001AC020DC